MELDLPISETLFWISAVVLGITTYYFLENGESYSKIRISITYFIAIQLILVLMTIVFGLKRTSSKIGNLFEELTGVVIVLAFFEIFVLLIFMIIKFSTSSKKKEIFKNFLKKSANKKN